MSGQWRVDAPPPWLQKYFFSSNFQQHQTSNYSHGYKLEPLWNSRKALISISIGFHTNMSQKAAASVRPEHSRFSFFYCFFKSHKYFTRECTRVEGLLVPIKTSIRLETVKRHTWSRRMKVWSRTVVSWVVKTNWALCRFASGLWNKFKKNRTMLGCRLVSNSSTKRTSPLSSASSHGPARVKSLRVPADSSGYW